MKTKEEILDETIIWEIFERRHPETAANILIAMQEYADQEVNKVLANLNYTLD